MINLHCFPSSALRAARRFAPASLALSLLVPWSPAVVAADIVWANQVDGAFDQGANWQGGVVPGADDTVGFSLDGATAGSSPYTVTLGSEISTQSLHSTSSRPASRHALRSSSKALAVTARIGLRGRDKRAS